MFDLLITNGRLVTPSRTVQADLAIRGEKIAGIFQPGSAQGHRILVETTGEQADVALSKLRQLVERDFE